MINDVSDVLEVLLLVKEVGLYDLVIVFNFFCIVFLFEIVEDFKNVLGIMDFFFSLFFYWVILVGSYYFLKEL